MLSEDMEMPPYWIGVQLAIPDIDGLIPDHERDIFVHFCEQECLIEFSNSNHIKERIMLVDAEDTPPEQPNIEE